MGASPSSSGAVGAFLDAAGNLTMVAGGDQDAATEFALRLEIRKFLDGNPNLRLMIDRGSASGTVFADYLDWRSGTFSCFFKLPAQYPGGGSGFLRVLLALCKSESVYGITAIHAGGEPVKKYLAGLRKAKKKRSH